MVFIVVTRESVLMRRLPSRLLPILLLLMLALTPLASAQTSDLLQPEHSAYDDDLPSEQAIAIYLPLDVEPPYPTVITIHGGGFFEGNLRTLAPLVRRFQAAGYAVANVTYRLVPGALYPAPVEDAFCALAWVSANADNFGIDRTRIAVLGESAGGYLAARLAVDDDPTPYLTGCPERDAELPALTHAILYYPIIDFLADDFQPIGGALAIGLLEGRRGLPEDGNREAVAALSVRNDVDGDEPPFLLIHGDRDRLVPLTQSQTMTDALAEFGVPAELLVLPGADHGFAARVGHDAGAEAVAAALAFLAEN
jgi:acetyl esterase/lipase